MEELGGEAALLHRVAGERWPWRAGDRVIVFGAHAAEFAAGLQAVAPAAEVAVNPDRAEAARALREFRGAIFLKGSRRYALETLLDVETAGAHASASGHGHRVEVAA
jgi:UDP-N-acetylmuramoyl-tripeptide--D-alanyl-D-alanine ligase